MSCKETLSTCVIWDGPNIDVRCLGVQIRQGDSINQVVYNSYRNLCSLLTKINVEGLDLTCITDLTFTNPTVQDLFNAILEKLCSLNLQVTELAQVYEEDNRASIPFCLQNAGDEVTITKTSIDALLKLTALKICSYLVDLTAVDVNLYGDLTIVDMNIVPPTGNDIASTITVTTSRDHYFTEGSSVTITGVNPDDFNGAFTVLLIPASNKIIYKMDNLTVSYTGGGYVKYSSEDPVEIYISKQDEIDALATAINNYCASTSYEYTPTCTSPDPGTTYPIETAYKWLETAFCQFKNYTGNKTELLAAVAKDCPNLGTLPKLSSGGSMNTIYGWVDTPVNAAQSINNLWLTVCDLRSAIQRYVISQCCSTTPCASFEVGYKLSFDPSTPSKYVDVIFNDGTNSLCTIYDLARSTSFNGFGPPPYTIPSWIATEFPNLGNVVITLDDGTGAVSQDTGQNIAYWINYEVSDGYYRFYYPTGYDPTAPIKTININFSYNYRTIVTTASYDSVNHTITYTTAVPHKLLVGTYIDITGCSPTNYNNSNVKIVAITEDTFTIKVTSNPGAFVSGGYMMAHDISNCSKCNCCCTVDITNGIY